MINIEEKLMDFVDKTPNAYYCVENIKKRLVENGYTQLYENELWDDLKPNGFYFVIRGDSSIIAFQLNKMEEKNMGFNIVTAHSDSPSFSIKPQPEVWDGSYLKLNINGYGGMINYTWFDRALSVAGRVIVKDKDTYKSCLMNADCDLFVIPSQAIHINRDVNENVKFNRQIDMLPLTCLEKTGFESIIKKYLTNWKNSQKICDYDLYLYNRDKAKLLGLNNEMILAPRLDDLASVYPSMEAFIASNNDQSINVLAVLNNEEIGSLTKQGADSTFLNDVLSRICKNTNLDMFSSINNSFMVSADNSHAVHPAAPDKNDPTNKVELNKGVVVKHHTNYTTDAMSSSIFKEICDTAKVPYQDYACRADMLCGATLGGISGSHVSIDSVDIGIPQLAMHSANETIGTEDVMYLYEALLKFYNCSIRKEKNKVKLIKK